MQNIILSFFSKSGLWKLSHNEVTWYKDFFPRCIFQLAVKEGQQMRRQVRLHIFKMKIQSNLTKLKRASALVISPTSCSPSLSITEVCALFSLQTIFIKDRNSVSSLYQDIWPISCKLWIFNTFLPERM